MSCEPRAKRTTKTMETKKTNPSNPRPCLIPIPALPPIPNYSKTGGSIRNFCHRIHEMSGVSEPLGLRDGESNPRVRALIAQLRICHKSPERLGLRNGGHFLEFWQKFLSGSRGHFLWYFLFARREKKVQPNPVYQPALLRSHCSPSQKAKPSKTNYIIMPSMQGLIS